MGGERWRDGRERERKRMLEGMRKRGRGLQGWWWRDRRSNGDMEGWRRKTMHNGGGQQ